MTWYPCCCGIRCCNNGNTSNEYDVTIADVPADPYADCANCDDLNGTYTLQYIDAETPAWGTLNSGDCWYVYENINDPYIWKCADWGFLSQAPAVIRLALRINSTEQDATPADVCRYEFWLWTELGFGGVPSGEKLTKWRYEIAKPSSGCSCTLAGSETFSLLSHEDNAQCDWDTDATITIEGPG